MPHKDPEARKKYQANYRKKNADKRKKVRREYYEKNKKEIKRKVSEYQKTSGVQRSYRKKYYEEWRKKNADKLRERRIVHADKILDAVLRRTYGITLEDYNKKLIEQGGLCAICRRPEQHRRRLSVDHDHETLEVRGLLCVRCNTSLGVMEDDVLRIRASADYLEKYMSRKT